MDFRTLHRTAVAPTALMLLVAGGCQQSSKVTRGSGVRGTPVYTAQAPNLSDSSGSTQFASAIEAQGQLSYGEPGFATTLQQVDTASTNSDVTSTTNFAEQNQVKDRVAVVEFHQLSLTSTDLTNGAICRTVANVAVHDPARSTSELNEVTDRLELPESRDTPFDNQTMLATTDELEDPFADAQEPIKVDREIFELGADLQPPAQDSEPAHTQAPTVETATAEEATPEVASPQAQIGYYSLAGLPVVRLPVAGVAFASPQLENAPPADTVRISPPVAQLIEVPQSVVRAAPQQSPVAQSHVLEAPIAQSPVMQSLVVQPPVVHSPSTPLPVMQSPVTHSPVSQASVAQPVDNPAPAAPQPAPATRAPTSANLVATSNFRPTAVNGVVISVDLANDLATIRLARPAVVAANSRVHVTHRYALGRVQSIGEFEVVSSTAGMATIRPIAGTSLRRISAGDSAALY